MPESRQRQNLPAPHWLAVRHVITGRATVYFRLSKQAKASIYICTTCMRYNRSRDGRGKHSRNRWYATTGPPPKILRRQAQRLSRFVGRALRSGPPDAEAVDVVVGGVVGGKLKVTWRVHPRCFGGAWTGGACRPGRSGPAAAPQVVWIELGPRCAVPAVADGRSSWSADRWGRTATATRRCWWTVQAASRTPPPPVKIRCPLWRRSEGIWPLPFRCVALWVLSC